MLLPMNNFIKGLSMCDLPPTLYSLMESIVNYNREDNDKVKIKDLPSYARSTIFDFNYPVSETFDKQTFEELFLKHYMFRRINFDTLTAFKIHLDVKLNSIMPKYNLMLTGFNSLNFLGNVETHVRVETNSNTNNTIGSNSSTSNTTDNSTTKNKFSDTPQNLISEVDSGEYVSEYTNITNNSTSGSTSTISNSQTSVDNGNLSENITITRADEIDEYKKYLEVANSIYEMIFKECDSLFYGVI